MPKTKISEFSATPANNTDIDSINIAEGCAPSGINDAIRELMAQLKDFQTGAQGDSFNGPVGSTTAATGAFTTLTTTGTINLLTVGRGAGAVATNTAVGASALAANTTGTGNTAVGYQAGSAITTAIGTTAVGSTTLKVNTGNYNTGIGFESLLANTSGASNTAVGVDSLYSNTTATNNSALGANALLYNTTGASNTAIGSSALQANTTASNNTAVGYQAVYSTTTGANNTGVGILSLYANTTGSENVAIGRQALTSNTTGINNTALGYQAGYTNTTGSDGTFVGYQAGYSSTGNANTYLGDYSGQNATTGIYNTFVGVNSGWKMTTGSRNSILGAYNGNQNSLDFRTQNNFVVLSDGDGNWGYRWSTGAGTYQQNNSASWSTTSDRRLKENDVALTGALALISSLRPVSFNWIQTKKADIGFIAQEYQTVFPEQVTQESGLDEVTKQLINDDTVLSITQNLTPYLVAAIKELKAEFDAYKASHP